MHGILSAVFKVFSAIHGILSAVFKVLSAIHGILSAVFKVLSAIHGTLSAVIKVLSAIHGILSAIGILEHPDTSLSYGFAEVCLNDRSENIRYMVMSQKKSLGQKKKC